MTDSAEKMELKPCPFCGEAAQLKQSASERYEYEYPTGEFTGTRHQVVCSKCGIDGKTFYWEKSGKIFNDLWWRNSRHEAKRAAIEAWNTRSAPSRVTGDEVGEAVKMLIAMKADCEQKNMPEGYIAKWCINFCEKYADTIIQASRPTALDQLKAAVGDKYEIIEGMNDRGMQPPPEADRQRALEALEKLANTPMEISLADWQEIVRPILAYLTAPQPHVGVEVTRRSFYPELAPDNQKQILALCGTKKIIDGAEYEWRHGGAYGHSGWHLIIESEITAQKNGDENG